MINTNAALISRMKVLSDKAESLERKIEILKDAPLKPEIWSLKLIKHGTGRSYQEFSIYDNEVLKSVIVEAIAKMQSQLDEARQELSKYNITSA